MDIDSKIKIIENLWRIIYSIMKLMFMKLA